MCGWRMATLTKTVPLPDGVVGVEMEIGYLTPTEDAAEGEREVADFLRRCADAVAAYGESKLLIRAKSEYEAIAAQVKRERAARLASLTEHARRRYVAGLVRQQYCPHRLTCRCETAWQGAVLSVWLDIAAKKGEETLLRHGEEMEILMPRGFLLSSSRIYWEKRKE